MILTLDPGAKACGVALFKSKRLQSAWLARTKGDWAEMARAVYFSVQARMGPHRLDEISTIVIERPQVYVASRSKGDPNDLITLALIAGRVTGYFPKAAAIDRKPAQWKGQVPKEIQIERTRQKLSPAEKERIEKTPKSLEHNVLDAIGIGLRHVGRNRVGRKK